MSTLQSGILTLEVLPRHWTRQVLTGIVSAMWRGFVTLM
jgi:hypothetical protein